MGGGGDRAHVQLLRIPRQHLKATKTHLPRRTAPPAAAVSTACPAEARFRGVRVRTGAVPPQPPPQKQPALANNQVMPPGGAAPAVPHVPSRSVYPSRPSPSRLR